jgi:hypothetical protein
MAAEASDGYAGLNEGIRVRGERTPDSIWVDNVPDLTELVRQWRPEWHRRAACRGQGPEAFYPEARQPADEALAICASCPVTAECAAAGQSERHGVWGGLTPPQRRQPAADVDGAA